MSAYTNQAAVLGEIQRQDLIALTDDDGSHDINTSILNQIIVNASGFIDSKVANIYGQQLPFNPVPSSVASMALTITCYRLFRRREVPNEKNKFTEAYNDVVAFLDRVNKGEAMIDDVVTRDFNPVSYTGTRSLYGTMGSNVLSRSL